MPADLRTGQSTGSVLAAAGDESCGLTAQASEKTMEVERLTAEKLTLEDMLRTVQADRVDEANDADADTSDTPAAAPPRAADASKAPALGRC